MIRFLQCVLLFFLISKFVDGVSSSEQKTFVRLFGRALRGKRDVSEVIKNCKHWRIAHSDDPDVTDVVVRLHNSAKSTKKMSSALQCHTMRKHEEPKLQYKVAAGATKEILFSISVSPSHYHQDSRVRKHKCLLSTWTEDPNSYITCKVTLSVWPNGLFFYNCSSYKMGQLSVVQQSSHMGTQIRLKNIGPKSLYLVNSSCTPAILTLTHTNKYKRLSEGEGWTLDFPASCDGRIGVNYKGQCFVSVFHVCLKTQTLIEDIKFDFMDGEIKECEHRKSMYSAYRQHWLASLVGMNHLSTAALVAVIVMLILAMLSTLALKFLLILYRYGSIDQAKNEFHQRFKVMFQNHADDKN